MRMTPEEYRIRFPDRRPPVPLEYAGKWLAWSTDHKEILAHADSLPEVRNGSEARMYGPGFSESAAGYVHWPVTCVESRFRDPIRLARMVNMFG